MSEIMPDLPDLCWPVSHGLCEGVDDFEPEVMAYAEAAAVMALRALTAYRVGGCAVVVRPCRSLPSLPTYMTAPMSGVPPYVFSPSTGIWHSAACRSPSCGCTGGKVLHLPAPVGPVEVVKIDGAVLVDTAYMLRGTALIRTDGEAWPATQDLTLPDTEVGTFSVRYLNAIPVDGVGAAVAGMLACEMAKAVTGSDCALPPGVTTIVRAGLSIEVPTGAFPDGLTGLAFVDQFVRFWNPALLRSAPTVSSVDV